MKRDLCNLRRPESGAALIVALILLMVMSLLGLSSIRSTSSQEKMSANAYDRSLAFQSAENALRMGEKAAIAWAKAGTPPSKVPVDKNGVPLTVDNGIYDFGACDDDAKIIDQSPCESGLCQIPNPNCKAR